MEPVNKTVPINLRQVSRILTQWALTRPPPRCETCGDLIAPTPFDDLDPPGVDPQCESCSE